MTATPTATTNLHDCRKAFAEVLVDLAEKDHRIVVVTNDSVSSSNLTEFRRRYSERLINVGIAEQDMVGVAAGLANGGYTPFVCGAAPFLTARALEQIKVDLAYSDVKVILSAMSPGVAYGALGPTHHSTEDIAWLRVIPNMTILVPADPMQTREATRWACQARGPVYLRIARTPVPDLQFLGTSFEAGVASVLRPGNDVTVIANGTMVARALAAAELLAHDGVSARVVNMATVKPLDEEAVIDAARTTVGIVTVEEHSVIGGLGGAVAELVVARHPVPMRLLGMPPQFAPTGSAEYLLSHFGLEAKGIASAAFSLLE